MFLNDPVEYLFRLLKFPVVKMFNAKDDIFIPNVGCFTVSI